MAETSFFWPFAVLAAGAAATYVWRALGVVLSGRIEPQGKLFEWIACIAYALLSALIARMILLPSGPLAGVPLSMRIGAAVLGLAVFFLARRNMPLGVACAVAALMALSWARGAGLI
jgi:branched-subunit amino acid transport protein